MIGIVVAPLIALGGFLVAKLGTGGGNTGGRKSPLNDPPPFTEEQIFGPPPVPPLAQYQQQQQQQAKAPPAPPVDVPAPAESVEQAPPAPAPMPMPPPDLEAPQSAAERDRAQELATLRQIVDNPTAANVAHLRAADRAELEALLAIAPPELAAAARALLYDAPAPSAPAALPSPMPSPMPSQPMPSQPSEQELAQQRLNAMVQELRDVIANPSPEALARFRDPANRGAIEVAINMVAAQYPDIAAAARRLLDPMPSRQDMEAVAQPSSAPVSMPATMPTPPPDVPSAPGIAQPPAGFDPIKARRVAQEVAANIQAKKYGYSRQALRDFQRFAGITADGLYGGASRAALAHFGVRRPPTALFAPTADQPYPWAT